MKARSLNELYSILYEYIKEKESLTGLCSEIQRIYLKENLITEEENILLMKHFSSQKPNGKLHKEFYLHIYYCGGAYWWHGDDIATEQRKLFIKKMIQITS